MQNRRFLLAVALALIASGVLRAQIDLPIYADTLLNGFQNWSWAAVNLANPAPVHSGSVSISVSAATWQALYLHHDDLDTQLYSSLVFWLNGGAAGGQRVQVQAQLGTNALAPYALPALTANTWKQFTIPLNSLGVANRTNFQGFWIQLTTATSTFYVDDIRLTALPPPTLVQMTINPAQTIRTADARLFGVNTAIWDSQFDTPATLALLQDLDARALRFPGGSLSDEYHWTSNTTDDNTWTWVTSFDKFAAIATNLSAQVFITANYGTGTPEEAAGWVRYANLTKGCGFNYWEIGNENYGGWEVDSNSLPHDPITYAVRATNYLARMKAVDPAIKVGIVAVTGEDAFANYKDAAHTVVNPRTGQSHSGWTPVLLTTLKHLGVMPDFVIYHRYPQNAGGESDAGLLQSSRTWANDAADLRQQLTDYLGAAAAGVELVCTENNSVSSGPGKQTTSLVNGLFLADSFGEILQTEFNAYLWWDLRNGRDTNNNLSTSLYGWRPYGDYGIIDGAASPYPTYYVGKLLKYFARGGDRIVSATTDYQLLAAYAAWRSNGSLSLLVINKSSLTNLNARINLGAYQPDANATIYSYGIPQDDAAETGLGSPDLAQSNFAGVAADFGFSFPPYAVTVISLAPGAPQLSVVSNPAFPGGPFQLRLAAQGGVPYVLEASPDLAHWTALVTNTLASNSWTWTEATAPNSPERFYRAVWRP
ncbi:MAG: alpha-L-arabinofuranosidase [Verrucomicrobia bacterium]|nr:alpha-L-arabinofuranosidase [Verrucomicrobiota bacterium]